ncbi:response regulator [Vulgatibacter sp.]|uniref:response regulator n=1 Tax=Vulgatibacter sp. TaxID=1971226 RepID=UPI0035656AD9
MQPATSTSSVLSDRILVVDDDVNFHRFAEASLGELGLKCVCVRSSEEAQRLLTGSVPKAVLVDGLLPGLRGDEFARRLRQKYPQGVLPIIFVSAFYRDMKSYKLLTQECGVDLVLHKPITPPQLRGAVEKLLKTEPAVTAEEELSLDDEIDLVMESLSEAADEDERESPEMMQLRAEYLVTSKERALELRNALGALSGPGAEDALHMIRVEGHRFRGSGASFGFPEISRLGGAVEELILQNDDLHRSGQLKARLMGLVDALADKVLQVAGSAPIPLERKVGGKLRRVLLVDEADSKLLADASAAAERNQPIDAVTGIDAALKSAIELRPDVIFLAAAAGEIAGAIQRLRAGTTAPVVVLGSKDQFEDWLGALHAGAVGYVAPPPDVESLFRIAGIYARPRVTGSVLAVGGDRSSLSGLAEILAPKGVAVEPCASTEEFFASLERAAPSLVILDGDLPKAKGIDLLRVLRADLNFRRVPVMIFSRLGAMQERIAAYEAGVDDWVARPIPPDELVVRILAQLARAGAGIEEQVRRGREPVTGLFDRSYLLEATTRALQLGRREGRQVTLLGIDLRLDGLRKERGRLAADEVLMSIAARLMESFRTSDVVARVGPGRIVALLHGAGKSDAERLLAVELEEIAGRSFAGGWKPQPAGAVAVFPEIAGGAEALLDSVESQLGK